MRSFLRFWYSPHYFSMEKKMNKLIFIMLTTLSGCTAYRMDNSCEVNWDLAKCMKWEDGKCVIYKALYKAEDLPKP